jgi:hypothetical protein
MVLPAPAGHAIPTAGLKPCERGRFGVGRNTPVSIRAALLYAISAELASQRKGPPDLKATLEASLAFDAAADAQTKRTVARQFLANVATRLRGDTPRLDFKWALLENDTLTDTLQLLIERMAENTSEISMPEKDAAKPG